jgi:hypothetical protein
MEPARVVHLNPTPEGFTPCCGRTRTEVRRGDRFTLDLEQVNCNGANPIRTQSIVDREAALKGRAKGALGRLLEVRARLERASSSIIDDTLRNELLGLIDRGLR